MTYTNEMRRAIRALDNPTDVPINVSQKGEQLYIIVERKDLANMTYKDNKNLEAYLREVKGIIKLGGGGDARVVVL